MSEMTAKTSTSVYNVGAHEFVSGRFPKIPPSSLNCNAVEYVPVKKISLNIEAQEFNPSFSVKEPSTSPSLLKTIEVPLDSQYTAKTDTEDLQIIENTEQNTEENSKILSKSEKIPIESVKIIVNEGDKNEIHSIDGFSSEIPETQEYSIEKILEA